MKFPIPLCYYSLLIVFTILITNSCVEEKNPATSPTQSPVRYLALGDSYTIGTGIDEVNNYPNQLSDSLIARGFIVDTTAVIATNGWTTSDLEAGIQSSNPDSSYTMVSLLIGVNNQYQSLELDLYKTEFRELLEKSIVFGSGDTTNVVVISIPNYGVTPFGQSRNPVVIRQEIQVYNDIAKNISAEYNVPFIDVTSISERAATNTALLASDSLHPSAKMYAMWVEEMLPTVTQIIKKND